MLTEIIIYIALISIISGMAFPTVISINTHVRKTIDEIKTEYKK